MSFHDILLALLAAVVIVATLRKLHMPPILGYLLSGLLVGPVGLGLFESAEELDFVAEFGVVFLLFTIGLEISLPKLIAMRRALLNMGGMQVLICTLLAIGAGLALGLSFPVALTVAGSLALSSTAVVTKQLLEQGELYQDHGKMALSILLFQDLAAVPFLILIPALAADGTSGSIGNILLIALLKGGLFFVITLAAGRWMLRPLFHQIAMARSSELFMLTTLLIALGSAWLTESFGLSLALGAFLTGVVLAETEYRHQIEKDILPFRDILLGLFFITVGMKLSTQFLLTHASAILAIVVVLILAKAIIIALIGHFAGMSRKVSIKAGLAVAQGGEFGFALLAIAGKNDVIDPFTDQMITAAIIISIFISPFLIRYSKQIAKQFCNQHKHNVAPEEDQNALTEASCELKGHVILCGYGRVGQSLARFLETEKIDYVGLDLDPQRLSEAARAKEPVFYGSSTRMDILEAASIDKAHLLILSYENYDAAYETVCTVREKGYNLPILVRTRDDAHLEDLQNAGASEVIPETLEASLTLATHMLLLLGLSADKIASDVKHAKSQRYHMLRAFYQGEDDKGHLEDTSETLALHAVEVAPNAAAVGQSIAEIKLRFEEKGIDIQITAYKRDGVKTDTIQDTLIIQGEDILVLQGASDALYRAEGILLQG